MAPYSEEAFEALQKQNDRLRQMNDKLRSERKINTVINVLTALGVAFMLLLIYHQQHQIKHQTTVIQDERRLSVGRACHDQNARHDNTIDRLDDLLKTSGVNAERRAQSRANTVLLINALAPKRNCEIVIANTVPSAQGD